MNIRVLFIAALLSGMAAAVDPLPFRPPAVPLVPVDPYFSIWSPADRLNDADTMHWTETPHRLVSVVTVDGKPFTLMGKATDAAPALPQTGLSVLPCTVTYSFEGAGVAVDLIFTTPLLPEDLMLLSRPVTYLAWRARAVDGKEHDIRVRMECGAEIAVNAPGTDRVAAGREDFGGVSAVKVGTVDQPVLGMKGDNVRINWGYLYLAADASQNVTLDILAEKPDTGEGLRADTTRLTADLALGRVSSNEWPIGWVMLAYDDVDSVQFFHENLKAYWKKDGDGIGALLRKSADEYAALCERCGRFDNEFMNDLHQAGGPKYALLGALAYRQSLAASKVVADAHGQPLFFCKENTSNGCMGTVDVFYPQAPLPLLFSPSLARAMLIPVLEYASSPRWTWPNAPHDVGTWPLGNGQVYGGASSDGGMPVEETGNMLLLVAAVAQGEGDAGFAMKYWPTLLKWAEYLKAKGFDPENQLCTDDFAGHLARNANLSVKSICALGAFGKLAALKGDAALGAEYTALAKQYALEWMKVADDGDHYRLAFDQPGTWSTKYNLVWDRILEMNLFPPEVAAKETAFYRRNLDTYGLPLDGRAHTAPGDRQALWSKTDWAFWAACLTENQEDFDAITAPAYAFFDAAERRVGLTDLYFTDKPDTARMHSRPVIGGVFLKMLYDKETWKKWADRDQTRANGPWAPLPPPPVVKTVVAPEETVWRYTSEKPADGWNKPAFKDGKWRKANGGFGTAGTPGITVKTEWNTPDIWLRGEITIPKGDYESLQLSLFHDEETEVYIDGVRSVRVKGYNVEYEPTSLSGPVTLGPGKHFFAVHCRNTTGGQGIDLGVVDVRKAER
ncbi:MAG TPA: DUF4965 domain-containing protein [Candidatus Hydrogenedentes bacterium]|nr:DUF4965 domain-containing protein [Candidatus Hydrogenedentota bacterium]